MSASLSRPSPIFSNGPTWFGVLPACLALGVQSRPARFQPTTNRDISGATQTGEGNPLHGLFDVLQVITFFLLIVVSNFEKNV
jgi:hypothetical protein